MTHALVITLLGEFSLIPMGQQAISFTGDRPISLLAYLLLHRNTAVSRQHLAFTLWPDSSDSQARTNLRNLLFTLRQTLPNADNYLAADAMTLQWRSDTDFKLDVAEFETALSVTKTAVSATDKIAQLETAVAIYQGELLPGNYDDWIIPIRENLRQNYLDALYQLVTLLEEQQDFRTAARYGQRLLQQDPLDETAYVQLMRLHARSGDRAGIRRIYELCLNTLRRELEVEPSPTTQAAYEQLLRVEAPVTAVALPTNDQTTQQQPPSLSPRPRPLPQPGTPFIGREAELAHVAELLAAPDCRLLTIIGPGGIGKTRLALQTAVGHARIFADGVIWVPLSSIQMAEQVAAAIADALHYRLNGTTQSTIELISLLTEKEVLIVLDNFEHLLESSDFLAELLAQTSAVKLLITSRQALDLQQEWRFSLEEMPLPDIADWKSLSTNSAIQLFAQSARRASSIFSLTPDDYTAVAQICHLVGGMPLGIELAASWTRLLTCAEIASEIEKNLDFLTVTLRDVPPRHRSLRAVFDYSWNLLSPMEQQALAQLAIFRGGFTREAAAQVAGAELSLLSSLTNHSLVQRNAAGRYNLHNIVRQYAHEYLLTLPATQVADQHHCHYYLQWLAEKGTDLCSSSQKETLSEISRELANIRAAWQTAVNNRHSLLLRGAAFTLFYFCDLRGLILEAEMFARQAADSLEANGTADKETRITICSLHTHVGYFTLRLGQVTKAESILRQAIAELQELEAESVLTYSLRYLGLVLGTQNYLDEALDYFKQSLELSIKWQQSWETAASQAYVGLFSSHLGDMITAQKYAQTALSNSYQLEDPRLTSFCLLISAHIHLMLGQLTQAEQDLAESMALGNQTNDPYSIDTARMQLGLVKQAQGEFTQAREFFQESINSYAYTKDVVGVARAQVFLGQLELVVGNCEAAKKLLQSLLQADHHEFGKKYALSALISLATIRANEGDPATALCWIVNILNHPALDWETQQQAQTLKAELETHLTPSQITAVYAQAKQTDFIAIVAAAAQPDGKSEPVNVSKMNGSLQL